MSDDIIRKNDLEFNQFVATEDDLQQISDNETTKHIVPKGSIRNAVEYSPVEFEQKDPVLAPTSDTHDDDVELDYKYVRDNLYNITASSIEALNNLSQIANQSQHPRAFEVLSLLVKTIGDTQKDLMAIHKDKVKIANEKAKLNSGGAEVVNNNLFVGTTAQLDEIIAKMTKKK
jgi:hypothetical protein